MTTVSPRLTNEEHAYLSHLSVLEALEQITASLARERPEQVAPAIFTHIADMSLKTLSTEERQAALRQLGGLPVPATNGDAHTADAPGSNRPAQASALAGMASSVSQLHHHLTLDVGVGQQQSTSASDLFAADHFDRNASIIGFNQIDLLKASPAEKKRAAAIRRKHTKIIATLGPSSQAVDTIAELVAHGVDAFRLNASHGSSAWHADVVAKVRKVLGAPSTDPTRAVGVGIAWDTRGPEIRLGAVFSASSPTTAGPASAAGEVTRFVPVVAEQEINLSVHAPHRLSPPDRTTFFVSCPPLLSRAKLGAKIVLDHGAVELVVTAVPDASSLDDPTTLLRCRVLTSRSKIRSYCKVHLPGWQLEVNPQESSADSKPLTVASLTPYEKEDYEFALRQRLEFLFLSYTRTANDINRARAALKLLASELKVDARIAEDIKIFAKIEDQPGVGRLDEIIAVADGVVISRHDLAADFPAKKIFALQKFIAAKCNVAGKPVVVVSQMLGSMVDSPHPNSTSCIDVTTAVIDGVDAITLSDESAMGEFPVEAVDVAVELSVEGEKFINRRQAFADMVEHQRRPFQPEEAVASAAVNTASELSASCIIALTTKGNCCQSVAKYAPACPVVAICKEQATAAYVKLVRGVLPLWYPGVEKEDRETRLRKGVTYVMSEAVDLARAGDVVVMLHGDLQNQVATGYANVVRVVPL